jgi:hypothetical protein
MGLAGLCAADCPPIDFEDLAVGTPVTTQYQGVTISGRNSDGSAGPTPQIWAPVGGTTSPTKCLGAIGTGPEFSPEFIRLVFDDLQREVTFTLGMKQSSFTSNTIQVRRYSNSGVLLGTQAFTLQGPLSDRVTHFARVGSSGGSQNIRRIEIEGTTPPSTFEFIDDLWFEVDGTPPVASITSPGLLECVCPPVVITGTADDPDGTFESYSLAYATDPNGPWTTFASGASPVIGSTLGTWSTTLVQGYYLIKLSVLNACGMDSEVVTVIFLDRIFDPITITSPPFPPASVVGGVVCLEGSITDCQFDHYTVQYAAIPGGVPLGVIDPATPEYLSQVVNGTIATWNTLDGPTPVSDGTWRLIVTGEDACGHTRGALRDFIVDNTPPVAIIRSPLPCGSVCGTVPIVGIATDAHFGSWVLQCTGGGSSGWTTIASGTSPQPGGVLATWDTSGLEPCAYTLRLIVSDTADVNCGGGSNSSSYEVSLNVGEPSDYNGDGVTNSQDYFDFLTAFFMPLACP